MAGFKLPTEDAGATSRAPTLKDFAMLEVSILLHTDGNAAGFGVATEDAASTEALETLYSESAQQEGETNNQLLFTTALRSRCLSGPADDTESALYAVLVFDQALVQLGSLAWGVSRNKVRNPSDAARLVAYAGDWAMRLLARSKESADPISPQTQRAQTSASDNSR